MSAQSAPMNFHRAINPSGKNRETKSTNKTKKKSLNPRPPEQITVHLTKRATMPGKTLADHQVNVTFPSARGFSSSLACSFRSTFPFFILLLLFFFFKAL